MSEATDLHEEDRREGPRSSAPPESEPEGAGAFSARLESADRWTRRVVREHPVVAVAAAAAAGFLVGRIAGRYR